MTATTLSRFLEYADDAGNWGGNPWVHHANVNGAGTPENNGFIVNMKKRGWITTTDYGDCGNGFKHNIFITFTEKGKALAAEHGIEIDDS